MSEQGNQKQSSIWAWGSVIFILYFVGKCVSDTDSTSSTSKSDPRPSTTTSIRREYTPPPPREPQQSDFGPMIDAYHKELGEAANNGASPETLQRIQYKHERAIQRHGDALIEQQMRRNRGF